MDEASTVAMEAIHEVIEARPLEKRQKEQHEAHLHQHHHAAGEGGHEGAKGAEGDTAGESVETEEDYEEEAVLKDDDRELDRVFEVRLRSLLSLPDDFADILVTHRSFRTCGNGSTSSMMRRAQRTSPCVLLLPSVSSGY